jgi:transposase
VVTGRPRPGRDRGVTGVAKLARSDPIRGYGLGPAAVLDGASRAEAAKGRRHGPPDAAGLGDKVQRTGARGPHQQAVAGRAGKLSAEHKAFLAAIVAAGPIPAIHGVVRWRACDLIMQVHEKFAISVSDDTVYRALKELGFSHVSARPKAYRQDPEAMEAFKKTSPSAWRKSARSLPRAHR